MPNPCSNQLPLGAAPRSKLFHTFAIWHQWLQQPLQELLALPPLTPQVFLELLGARLPRPILLFWQCWSLPLLFSLFYFEQCKNFQNQLLAEYKWEPSDCHLSRNMALGLCFASMFVKISFSPVVTMKL
jgi:hypothetical protein